MLFKLLPRVKREYQACERNAGWEIGRDQCPPLFYRCPTAAEVGERLASKKNFDNPMKSEKFKV